LLVRDAEGRGWLESPAPMAPTTAHSLVIEQDHRAMKCRCATMSGFKSFRNAAITVARIELAHRIRKRQFSFAPR
jgi:transposase-like protein